MSASWSFTQNPDAMKSQYEEKGFFLIESFINARDIARITQVVDRFHDSWTKENEEFYRERAINSAYLTGKDHLGDRDREVLFEFIASDPIFEIVSALPFKKPAFMNTQLFFDPVNPGQKNYWHRDSQYHLSPEDQKQALQGAEVMHFRIALEDEPGVELIPGTHRRWDTEEELNTRLELSGNRNFQDLSTGLSVPLKKGDLLVFSANMIHRGIYGNGRKALDILFCDAKTELLEFAGNDCLPDSDTLKKLDNPVTFLNTIAIRGQS